MHTLEIGAFFMLPVHKKDACIDAVSLHNTSLLSILCTSHEAWSVYKKEYTLE
jgi:hypothetical protein